MEWKKVEEGKDDDLSALLTMPAIGKLPSKNPVEKIRRAVLINSCWGLLIAGLYVYVLLRYPIWQISVCLGFMLFSVLWVVAKALLLRRKLSRTTATNTLLQEMELQYGYIRQWINLQRWVGLGTYPVSLAGGFMLGAHFAGKSLEVIMHNTRIILSLATILLVLAPVCYYLTRWMTHKAFGQHAGQLKANIDALKNEG